MVTFIAVCPSANYASSVQFRSSPINIEGRGIFASTPVSARWVELLAFLVAYKVIRITRAVRYFHETEFEIGAN